MGLWAVVPVKERVSAKERLAPMLRPESRQALALAMLEDVLAALTATPGIAGLVVVTVDDEAGRLAAGYGARLIEAGARDGHTGAVTAAARLLAAEGSAGMLTLPGDIPLVTPAEIASVLAAHPPAPLLHDSAVARRARLERDRLLAARRGAFALWRKQFLPTSTGG